MEQFNYTSIRSNPGNPRKARGHVDVTLRKKIEEDPEERKKWKQYDKETEFLYIAWMDEYNPGEPLLYMDKKILEEYRNK